MTSVRKSQKPSVGKPRSQRSVRGSSWIRHAQQFFSSLLIGRRIVSVEFQEGLMVWILKFDDGGSVCIEPLRGKKSDCSGMFAGKWPPSPNDLKLSDCGARRGSCVVRRSEGIRAREKMARTKDARTRNSSYRDARSSSLQRMVRRCGFWS